MQKCVMECQPLAISQRTLPFPVSSSSNRQEIFNFPFNRSDLLDQVKWKKLNIRTQSIVHRPHSIPIRRTIDAHSPKTSKPNRAGKMETNSISITKPYFPEFVSHFRLKWFQSRGPLNCTHKYSDNAEQTTQKRSTIARIMKTKQAPKYWQNKGKCMRPELQANEKETSHERKTFHHRSISAILRHAKRFVATVSVQVAHLMTKRNEFASGNGLFLLNQLCLLAKSVFLLASDWRPGRLGKTHSKRLVPKYKVRRRCECEWRMNATKTLSRCRPTAALSSCERLPFPSSDELALGNSGKAT